LARERGIRLLGPNTNGLLNATDHLSLGYNAEHGESFEIGPVSVISHSGALMGGFVRCLRRLGHGIGKFVPVGNEADVTMLDVLEFLIEDEATRLIGLVVEALSDGARFKALAARARAAGKPIVALKIGRSSVGIESTSAHSSRLAGNARAYDALFAACGVASVRSVEALAGGCALLGGRTGRAVRGDQKLVCVSSSGAGGTLLADFAAATGISLAGDGEGEWQGDAAKTIAALPNRGRMRNPIDTGSFAKGWSQLAEIYDALEDDGLTGPTAVFAHIAPTPAMDRAMADALIARRRRTETPIAVAAPGGLNPDIEAHYIGNGIPVFHDLPTSFDTLRCHYATLPRAPSSLPATLPDADRATIRESLAAAGTTILNELDSAALLRRAGVPIVASRVVRSAKEATEAASGLGHAVVLKGLAPGISHKSEHGLVMTGLATHAAGHAFTALEKRLAALGHPNAPIILQPELPSQAELILGASRDRTLGHFLVAGLGGVLAETLDQVVLMPIPLGWEEIRAALASAPVGRVLARLDPSGHRLAATIVALEALQKLVLATDLIESIDVNPLLVGHAGCVAVDALVVLRERENS
jgi:acyl-CoA synthetase (NDP forming)